MIRFIASGRVRSFLSLQSRLPRKRSLSTIFECVDDGSLSLVPIDNIRNFSVIAHVDHGKSTLSDAILALTGNIGETDRKKGQVLDTLKVERERGITVKAQTASMIFDDKRTGQRYLLNLIDTPGHIDFSYEVSRSLASCQGALLLVDSSQSIQAQTLSNYEKARVLGLDIIPIVTKIDLPNAQPEEAALNMGTTFGVDPDKVIMTSAKMRIGIQDVLEAVVDRLPSPRAASMTANGPCMARIVDSWYDEHRGVVCLIQMVGGSLKEGQRITTFASSKVAKHHSNIGPATSEPGKIPSSQSGASPTPGSGAAVSAEHRIDYSVQEIGILTPGPVRTKSLLTGQVGYVIAGMRSTRQARIGDTIFIAGEWSGSSASKFGQKQFAPLPGYEEAKPMLFASVFPVDSEQLNEMMDAVDRLLLNDSSISVTRDQSASLGSGLRCGFLGFLHMEVFNQRLQDEFDMGVVMTTPSVPYVIRFSDGEEKTVSCVSHWPSPSNSSHRSFAVLEPIVKVVLITPAESYGAMIEIMKDRRGMDISTTHLDDGSILISSLIPWAEVVCDMNDQVKHLSAGYASFNYEDAGFKEANLVKVEIAVNGEECDPLSFVAHASKAESAGRKMALKLKETLSRQQFEIVIQAKVGSKVLARERIAPYRKDVLARSGKTVGGGDITRKQKLLNKQKEGKKRAKIVGKVEIGQEAFFSVLKKE